MYIAILIIFFERSSDFIAMLGEIIVMAETVK